MFGRSPYQSSSCIVRLNCERLEAREVPAVYFVKLHSLTTGDPFLSSPEATVGGFLDLNASYPSVTNGGIAVDAASATDAVRQGLFGRIGVRHQGASLYYDYGLGTSHTNPLAEKPFLVTTAGVPYMATMYKVKLEDLAYSNLANWDYDDRVWLVESDDGTSPPPPPNTVGASPPYVPGVQLEFLDKNHQGKTDGKVAKWQTAYEEVAGKVRVKGNFVATEDDRYYIQIKDTNYAGQPNLTRTVRVISDSDLGNDLTVRAFPDDGGGFSGVFRSDPFVLVSNGVDDEWVVNGKADNTTDDQTFRVKLGDTLTISYTSIAVGHTVHKRVPIRVLKEAKVHITVMTNDQEWGGPGDNSPLAGTNNSMNAVQGVTEAQVTQWLAEANETYAQVGVRLVLSGVQFADQPKKLANTNDMDVNLSDGMAWPVGLDEDREARGLIRGNRTERVLGAGGQETAVSLPLRTPENDDVELFVVNYFSVPLQVPDGKGGFTTDYVEDEFKWGFSFPDYYVTGKPTADLVDSAMVNAKRKFPFTLAHEIGHLLTDAMHIDEGSGPPLVAIKVEPNLMRTYISRQDDLDPPVDPMDPDYAAWRTASKRLDDNQQGAIWTKRTAIVQDYVP
jgi:hypothetical protein